MSEIVWSQVGTGLYHAFEFVQETGNFKSVCNQFFCGNLEVTSEEVPSKEASCRSCRKELGLLPALEEAREVVLEGKPPVGEKPEATAQMLKINALLEDPLAVDLLHKSGMLRQELRIIERKQSQLELWIMENEAILQRKFDLSFPELLNLSILEKHLFDKKVESERIKNEGGGGL